MTINGTTWKTIALNSRVTRTTLLEVLDKAEGCDFSWPATKLSRQNCIDEIRDLREKAFDEHQKVKAMDDANAKARRDKWCQITADEANAFLRGLGRSVFADQLK